MSRQDPAEFILVLDDNPGNKAPDNPNCYLKRANQVDLNSTGICLFFTPDRYTVERLADGAPLIVANIADINRFSLRIPSQLTIDSMTALIELYTQLLFFTGKKDSFDIAVQVVGLPVVRGYANVRAINLSGIIIANLQGPSRALFVAHIEGLRRTINNSFKAIPSTKKKQSRKIKKPAAAAHGVNNSKNPKSNKQRKAEAASVSIPQPVLSKKRKLPLPDAAQRDRLFVAKQKNTASSGVLSPDSQSKKKRLSPT